MKVRGAVLREMGLEKPYSQTHPLAIEQLELDGPGAGELLVRVRAAGLCHSDLSVIDGSRPRVMPMVLGHEAAGEVVEAGPKTRGFGGGGHVIMAFGPACGGCEACRSGRAALCDPGAAANVAGELLGGTRRWNTGDGDEVMHHHLGVSAFADHAVVSARSAVKVDPSVPYEVAALFGCAVLTGVGAVQNSAGVKMGETVAVFGLGGVGLAALLGAHLGGASRIVAVDILQSKLDLAKQLGATDVVLAGEKGTVENVRTATGGGAHKATETRGNPKVLGDAYAATRRGGTTVTVGLPHPSKMLEIPAVSLVAEERTLRGSYLGSAVPALEIPKLVELYKAGLLPVDRLLTHRLVLDEVNEGFDRLASGEAVRQAIVFG